MGEDWIAWCAREEEFIEAYERDCLGLSPVRRDPALQRMLDSVHVRPLPQDCFRPSYGWPATRTIHGRQIRRERLVAVRRCPDVR